MISLDKLHAAYLAELFFMVDLLKIFTSLYVIGCCLGIFIFILPIDANVINKDQLRVTAIVKNAESYTIRQ